MDYNMKIHKEIAYYTSRKEFYKKAEEWGKKAVKIFYKIQISKKGLKANK